MKEYHALIVGAGPAGGECARELAKKGLKVLLIEKAKTFQTNNFSSAGAPLEIMTQFALPDTVVGSYWSDLELSSSQRNYRWKSESPKGVILDFAKLRLFLTEEACRQGAEFKLGCAYQEHHVHANKCRVTVRNLIERSSETICCKWIIDASGSERSVIQNKLPPSKTGVTATGIEFLVEVHPDDYATHANTMALFLGSSWMPQGYSWIFPMQAQLLKIGIARYFVPHRIVSHQPSMQFYMDQMLAKTLKHPHQLVDRHGKTLRYTYGRKDTVLNKETKVIAIGDAISTLNPLAGEGIRHAMYSSRLLGHSFCALLEEDRKAGDDLTRALQRHFNWRWKMSEWHMKTLYTQKNDANIDAVVAAFEQLKFDEMLDFAFNYKLSSSFTFYKNFLKQKLKRFLKI